MTLRAGHGNGAGSPRVEVIADELPAPGNGALRPDAVTADRGVNGRFAGGNRAGAVPKAAIARVVTSEGDALYRRFARSAGAWRRARCRELALLAGGTLGVGPSAHVGAAARGMADACYVRSLALAEPDTKERVTLLATANRIESQWKQSDAMAYELAIREGKARSTPADAPFWTPAPPAKDTP